MEETYICPKMTPKQWIANVWYYYKWMILLAIVVIAFLSICIVQFATKKDADMGILVVSGTPVKESTCSAIVSSAESFVHDTNCDGEVSVQINAITLSSRPPVS